MKTCHIEKIAVHFVIHQHYTPHIHFPLVPHNKAVNCLIHVINIHFWTEFCEGTHFYVSIHLVFKPISLCSDGLLQQNRNFISCWSYPGQTSSVQTLSSNVFLQHISQEWKSKHSDHLDHTWFLNISTRLVWRQITKSDQQRKRNQGEML